MPAHTPHYVRTYLRNLAASLDQFASYGEADLALHAICEGDLELVSACKRTIYAARDKGGRSQSIRSLISKAAEEPAR
jgi:hypothetical protein